VVLIQIGRRGQWEYEDLTQKIWFGGVGSIDYPYDWITPGFIGNGDTLTIGYGTVQAANAVLTGLDIEIAGPLSSRAPTLELNNVILSSSLVRVLPFLFDHSEGYSSAVPGDMSSHATLSISGAVVSDHLIVVGNAPIPVIEEPPPVAPTPEMPLASSALPVQSPGVAMALPALVPPQIGANLTAAIQPGGVLVNMGLIEVAPGSILNIEAPGGAAILVNNGDIESSGALKISAHLSGVGVISSFGSVVEINEAVDSSETIGLGSGRLVLSKPMQFLGQIEQYTTGGSTVELLNTNVTDTTFADFHLKLFDGTTLAADLNLPYADVPPEVLVTNQDGNAFVTFNTYPNVDLAPLDLPFRQMT
jgi:hypothetical protein